MAHEISIRANGKAEMAFVGQTPWHGLGQQVTPGASIGVWVKEAGMDWTAKESPVFYHASKDKPGTVRNDANSKVIYRSDTGESLATVSKKYNIVQPVEVLEFFRDLTEDGGWHIHTAGVLRGGRKLWAMASNGDGADVFQGKRTKLATDMIKQNLLLATSLDGSMKTMAGLTAIRVVCANTLAIALQENGEMLKISHRSVFDPDAIKKALGVSVETFKVFMRQAQEMAETPIALDESLDVLRRIFGQPEITAESPGSNWLQTFAEMGNKPLTAPDGKETRATMRVLELFDGAGMGSELKTAKGTRWGLFNAVTQHVDHELGRTPNTRLDSAWFGRGNGYKQQAFAELSAI